LNALPGIFAAVILFLIFLVIVLVVRKIVEAVFKKGKYDESTSILFSRLSYYVVLVVGIIAAFSVGGVDLAALMISFGMIGFAVGFALKDIISNFLGGILIFIYKPFVIGNAISVKGFSGTVEKIDVRATEIKTFDGLRVIIPNSDMIANPVTNYSLSTMRRVTIPVGIGYDNDLSKAYDRRVSKSWKKPSRRLPRWLPLMRSENPPSILIFGSGWIQQNSIYLKPRTKPLRLSETNRKRKV